MLALTNRWDRVQGLSDYDVLRTHPGGTKLNFHHRENVYYNFVMLPGAQAGWIGWINGDRRN